MNPDNEPFDLDAYLVELNLPDTFTKAWVAVNVGSHVTAGHVALYGFRF